ncbi:protein rotatin homolog [Toxorhynchites rutilus septentrionalis]|uniref:protein rotatin homolog n=1 Tax=Toxorhynchites rutilus septentrionalis TaxID=329112 RepID=UPI00247A6656|nr:protein rotatin homolog [Toxorhynchites rutilus septentrionalis]
MTLVINHDMLGKLTHEIQEIRIRALHDIENKVKRALWEQQEIKFSPTSLVKNLIRWFGIVPISEEAAVLELLSLLLASKYGTDIANYFTCGRLLKELGKVKYLIGSKPELAELVDNVVQLVNTFKECERAKQNPDSIAESFASLRIECIDLTKSPSQSNSNLNELSRSPNYFTKCWNVPLPSDAKTLKDLNESLHIESNEKDIQHAFNYLVPSISDYPPEFFLQPPYILHSLIKLSDAKKVSIKATVEVMHRLTIAIQKRLSSLQLTSMYTFQYSNGESPAESQHVQISIPAFVHEIYLLCINWLKDISDDTDLQETNKIFYLFSELNALAMVQHLEEFQFREIRHELGYLAKYFRQSWESNSKSFTTRTKYLVTVKTLSEFLQTSNHAGQQESSDNDTCFPHKPRYNPAEFETMNSTGHRKALEDGDQNWQHELQIAGLDYPMRHIYPTVYEALLEQALKVNNRKLQVLLNADEIFAPAVTLLRQSKAFSDEEVIALGLEAIDTLYLHRSTDMVKLMISAVGRCRCHFEGNPALLESAEKLILRLLSHSDIKVKSTAYDSCNDIIKDFISSLDEGAIITHRKSYAGGTAKLSSLGIPLTVDILVEIICFGYYNSNKKIHQRAETILLFLLNSRAFLLDRWSDLLDIILPVLPLLQTITISDNLSTLSRTIVALLHPDSDLPATDLIRGNLRFLFHNENEIREEAMTRILFLMSITPNARQYSPNIDHVRDTVSNGICLLKSKYDIAKHLSADVYEVSAIRPLLDTLEQDNCDPAMRRSALVQLNVMAEDPILCEIIHKANGWAFVLQALDNALREDYFLDYPDSAMPAIGILTKMCLAVPEFRRFLADNVNIYHLIMRALLTYHHMPIFKPDCCTLLFVLLFSEYTLGSGKSISLPLVCFKYSIPFVAEHHWKCSPFSELSYLEEIFIDVNEKKDCHFSVIEPLESPSILRFKSNCGIECASTRMPRAKQCNDESINEETPPYASRQQYRQVAWQYLRLAFACQWFDAFENILVNAKKCINSPEANKDADAPVIDYSLLPPHLVTSQVNDDGEEVVDLGDQTLQFDRILQLTRQDVDMIRTTHVEEIFRNSLKSIATASSHAEVSVGLSGLESNLILPMQDQLLHNSIVKHLKKFILTPPNTPADEKLLIDVIGLLGQLIQIGYENVLVWIANLLLEQTSIFINLLKSDTCSGQLFMKNVDFIKIVLIEALSCENPDMKNMLIHENGCQKNLKPEEKINLLNKLFETIFGRLDNDLQKCDIMRILSLISLARVIVQSVLIEFDNKYLNHVVNKLCSYISLIRSITYSGSTISKNCLIIIALLLDQMKDVHLKTKHFKVLALQCSHTSALNRACAWNVLAKVAKSLSGAHSIIKECAYLPGGIHASCAKTLLDPEEASLVKESATGLLINLLSHREPKGGPLHKFMVPYDKSGNSQLDADPLVTVLSILKKHRFFEQALASLRNFTTRDNMAVGEYAGIEVVTCDVVKSYSMVFSCLVDLDIGMVDFLVDKCCLQQLMNCVSSVPIHPGRSALLMVSEVCNLLVRCLTHSKDKICDLISPYQAVIGGIIYLLNVDLYSQWGESVLCEVTSNVMHLLNVLALHKIGNQLITCVLSELKLEPLVKLIVSGISNDRRKDYQVTCLRFLTLLVLTSDASASPTSEFQSLLNLLETVLLEPIDRQHVGPKAPNPSGATKRFKSLEQLTNGFSSEDDQENQDPNAKPRHHPSKEHQTRKGVRSGSGLIFAALVDQYQHVCAKDKPENGALVSTLLKRTLISAIQVMLRRSEKARCLARMTQFLVVLIDRLEVVYSGIGVSYQDFVRKNGDSKKAPIVEELSLIAGILSAWFANDILVHQASITRICKVFLQFWPWISHNRDLESAFMRALVCLTENSIMVCKSLTVSYPGHAHSILKLAIAIATAETGKVKGPHSELVLLKLCLRILTNCCSCHEGRTMICKFNVLDNISKLHPAVTKLQRPWTVVTLLWLEFWEIYSRHNDVTEVKHLTVLGALIRKSSPELRKLSLEIMRNMSFIATSRPALLASADYMHTLKSVLDGTDCGEQLIVVSAIWKIIANNHRGKSAIKSTPIPRRLNALLKQRSLLENCEDDDLFNVLNIVVKLLNS